MGETIKGMVAAQGKHYVRGEQGGQACCSGCRTEKHGRKNRPPWWIDPLSVINITQRTVDKFCKSVGCQV
jgi:hypothetical protein